jgi:hypothetical protein
MSATTEDIAAVLRESAETHHIVYQITDGTDPDWASWYADWRPRRVELGQPSLAIPV